MANLKVFGCKELSVLSDFKANLGDTVTIIKVLKEGEVVSIDTSRTYWSYDDKQYYEVDLGYGRVGYVRTDALRVV